MSLLSINLKNPKDYNRAIQFLKLANVRLADHCRERDLTVATIEVIHVYDYTCPHCWAEYTELREEFETHYNQETGFVRCQCGKELKPLFKHTETVIPELIKSHEEEDEVVRLVIDQDEYERVHELLRLAGIEVYDLEHIEQVVIHVNQAYHFDCPSCGEHQEYLIYEHEEFYVDYNFEEKKIHCNHCNQDFKATFKTNENVVFE